MENGVRGARGRLGSRGELRRGQIMLITVIVLGATLLLATSVGGLLLIFQIRQGGNLAASAQAFYAADAGVEWGLYEFVHGTTTAPLALPTFANGETVAVTCYDASGAPVNCTDGGVKTIRSVGSSRQASRALEAAF